MRALAAALLLAAAPAAACPLPRDFAPQGRVESKSWVLAYRAVPAPIAVGRQFALEVVACGRSGAAPAALRVDAQMPEHRHGMNYRATVAALGDGRFRAEGLLFHMPGRWQLLFDVESGAQRERLASDLVLE